MDDPIHSVFIINGHSFWKVRGKLWLCSNCGATKYTKDPQEGWAKFTIYDNVYSEPKDFENCAEACVINVMMS